MQKKYFETQEKNFSQKLLGVRDNTEARRYILIFAFLVYAIQFFYFKDGFLTPLKEGSIFYTILLSWYFIFNNTTLTKWVFYPEEIEFIDKSITYNTFNKNPNPLKNEAKKETIPLSNILSLKIIENGFWGIGNFKGILLTRGDNKRQTTHFFRLDSSELTNLQYFLNSNPQYKEKIK